MNILQIQRLRCGTAQGSILGPLIYIIYVNDVLGLFENDNNLDLHADDMLILSSHNNVENMMYILQKRMDKIYEWCAKNKLTVNELKTKYMIVNNLKVEPISTISIAGHDLNRMPQYEYLGMMTHEKLNMDVQIESMYKKANKKPGILSRIRGFITTKTAARVYKTMIRPHLEYVDFII